MGNNELIGERLSEERRRLGLNQTVFSATAQITRKTLFGYESGARSPDAQALAMWAAIGLDVAYVVTGKRSSESNFDFDLSAEEQVVLDYYRAATSDTRKAALGALVGASLPLPKASR